MYRNIYTYDVQNGKYITRLNCGQAAYIFPMMWLAPKTMNSKNKYYLRSLLVGLKFLFFAIVFPLIKRDGVEFFRYINTPCDLRGRQGQQRHTTYHPCFIYIHYSCHGILLFVVSYYIFTYLLCFTFRIVQEK